MSTNLDYRALLDEVGHIEQGLTKFIKEPSVEPRVGAIHSRCRHIGWFINSK